jgi:predicted AlkP superfamily pyrophosphatase or phosphodiesterase
MIKNLKLPNYEDGSLVNLMSSIIHHFNGVSQYKPLKDLPLSQLKGIDSIVLILLDGLGYNFFIRNAKLLDYPIMNHLHAKVTSVFPSTTAAAMTSIYTGVAPKNHGCLAWFTYLKEVGLISTIPPLKRRGSNDYITNKSLKANDILQVQSIFEKIPNADSYFIISENLKDSPYDSVVSKGTRNVIGFSDFPDSMNQIMNLLQKKSGSNKFILHYWEGIDSRSHLEGTEKAVPHFKEIFEEIIVLSKKIKGLNSKVAIFITADHGLIDIPKDRVIKLEDHPKLEETLILPLCGESRAAFCFVRAPYREKFEYYINNEFNEYCTMLKMQDLIDMDIFGLFKAHPRFKYRVPDYLLLMKDNYMIIDKMLKETRVRLKAVHGGLSEEELFVPLLLFRN